MHEQIAEMQAENAASDIDPTELEEREAPPEREFDDQERVNELTAELKKANEKLVELQELFAESNKKYEEDYEYASCLF